VSTEGGIKAVIAALIANTGIAIAKFVAFFVSGSSSMLTEAVHSVADAGNQVLLLVGSKRAKVPISAEHQFGYGRIRYVYAFIVAIVLFSVGGLFSLYEGLHKFQHPEPLSNPIVPFTVLAIAIVLESFSLRTALKEANAVRGRRSLWQFIKAARQPELPVILLEDIGALTGLVFAFGGVSMATITEDARWDGVGALSVGVLLVVIAIILAIEMSGMLVGESALEEDQKAIEKAILNSELTKELIHLRTLYVGPDEILVAVKVGVDGSKSASELAALIDQCEIQIRLSVPSAKYVFIEPDIYQPEMAKTK
jgi:cation diffusion facilitator family transporter